MRVFDADFTSKFLNKTQKCWRKKSIKKNKREETLMYNKSHPRKRKRKVLQKKQQLKIRRKRKNRSQNRYSNQMYNGNGWMKLVTLSWKTERNSFCFYLLKWLTYNRKSCTSFVFVRKTGNDIPFFSRERKGSFYILITFTSGEHETGSGKQMQAEKLLENFTTFFSRHSSA